jgi:hypothetical protein
MQGILKVINSYCTAPSEPVLCVFFYPARNMFSWLLWLILSPSLLFPSPWEVIYWSTLSDSVSRFHTHTGLNEFFLIAIWWSDMFHCLLSACHMPRLSSCGSVTIAMRWWLMAGNSGIVQYIADQFIVFISKSYQRSFSKFLNFPVIVYR